MHNGADDLAESPGTDPKHWVPVLKNSFERHLTDSLAQDHLTATQLGRYNSFALAIRDQLIRRWLRTQETYDNADTKRVYYLSLEFLLGRMLGNNLINLQLYDASADALRELGYRLEDLREMEWDAGLGNGGLGRLAACFLDSLATLQLPAYGYGIRYEYGIFFQHIRDGAQVETPDNWLRYGNVWENPRPERIYLVQFYGRITQSEMATDRTVNGSTPIMSLPWRTISPFRDTATPRPTISGYGRPSRCANSTWTTSIMEIISAP
jgi:glucan phosphorylase